MIDGLVALMDSDVQEPVNIGNPDERSILDLAKVIIELCDSDSGITHEPRPPQDPNVRRPEITKAKRELGWQPDIDLRDGLERTVEYFRPRV